MELGIDLPFISRFGGFMDPFIDWVEDAFGARNADRDLFPDNTFGGFEVDRGSTVLFRGSEVNFQPGDLVFSVKHQFEVPREWPRLALRGLIKAPTGDPDEVLGSGEPDFGIGAAADYSPWRRLMLYANFNLVYPVGPITDGDLTLNPIFTQSFAAHLAITQHWSALFHQASYTSPYHGTGASLLDGTVVELGFGVAFAWSERFGMQLLCIQNVSGVAAIGRLHDHAVGPVAAVGRCRRICRRSDRCRRRRRCRRSARRHLDRLAADCVETCP